MNVTVRRCPEDLRDVAGKKPQAILKHRPTQRHHRAPTVYSSSRGVNVYSAMFWFVGLSRSVPRDVAVPVVRLVVAPESLRVNAVAARFW